MSLPGADKGLGSPDTRGVPVEGAHLAIVYFEDNPSNIALMSDLLADFGPVELVTAPTAEIGIELARARRPHLIIMDIDLPGLNGREAARRLREWPETQSIPIIALGASMVASRTKGTTGADFQHHLKKPVKIDELIGVLTELLTPGVLAGM